jgi:zinc/manganese transport system substrate-binding protein
MTTRHKTILFAGLAVLLVGTSAHGQDRISVAETLSILGDFVKNVGGDRIEVTTSECA